MEPIAVLHYPLILYDSEDTSQTESISSYLVRWRKKFDTNQRRIRLTTHPGPIVLPPEPDNRFVDLIFLTESLGDLHVRFVISTLHCIAFSLDGIKWHEVLVNPGISQRIMPSSTLVKGFTSTRASLSPCDRDVTKASLINCVSLLIRYIKIYDENESKGRGEEKVEQVANSELERAFGVIVTIFCEGARFRCIANSIARNFEGFQSYNLEFWANQWITNWRHISRILQAVDHYNETGLFPGRYATSDHFIQGMESEIRRMSLTIPGRGSFETFEEVRLQMAVMKFCSAADH